MPVMHCQCGRTTNTATARWVGSTLQDPNPIEGSLTTVLALECYAAFDQAKGAWVAGCAKDIPVYQRSTVAKLLASDSNS
jgi:hypothetical protein